MRLQTRIVLGVVFVFIIVLFALGYLFFNSASKDIENKVNSQLNSISDTVERNIETYLQGQMSKISLIANQNELTSEELDAMVSNSSGFYDMFLINSSGIVVESSNRDRIGLYRGNRDYFINARNETYLSPVYFALVPKQYSISVSAPFHGGVLVGSMKIESLNHFTESRIGLGNTGENLLAFRENNSIVYFTSRRFSNVSFEKVDFNQSYKNLRAISRSLNNEEGIYSDLLDYRGVKVLAATNFLESIGVGLVSKIDNSEAFASVNKLLVSLIIYSFFALVLLSTLVYFITRRFVREIEDTTSSINNITRGDFDVKLSKGSTDEVKRLNESLNRVLASLKLAILRVGVGKEELGIGDLQKAKSDVEDKFKAILDNAEDQIFSIDSDLKYLSANPITVVNLGKKKEEEIIGKSIYEISPKGVADQFAFNLKRVIRTGKTFMTEEVVELPKGKTKLSTKLVPIKDENGKVKTILGFVREFGAENAETKKEEKKKR